ncbi:hypothetical protein [Riemerella anatipestifer]|uniref:hypothetical protein n=1 Tax=Riemerella anatipestifer TaxID=34085 RepID=UPI00129DF8E9|nr:hypothetical protein [Riemerella anatipestifer]MCQ4154608.1 hypothetical protein [Riemerella anatipestifer]MCU7542409.1 hypothetical protein [Riemerella anatipestifer]MDR7694652.1 hypothetical protein [Riemerella anatipestifer]MDR7774967.1 hypothetical protein [Riemerella anatipestifer]MDR7793889.1 hypothetical protein [Riemerella anatipestifer]
MFKIIEVRYWILDVRGWRFSLRVDGAILSSKFSYLTSNLKKRLSPLNTHKTRGKAKAERK